jgi:hypothetical protein
MKNKIFTLFCIMTFLCSCSAKDGNFEISIKSSEANNMIVRLFKETADGLVVVDSSKFEVSRAYLKGFVQSAELMYLYVGSAPDYLPVFVEKGTAEIDLNFSRPSKSAVRGSETHKIFTDFVQSYSVYSDRAAGIDKMLTNACRNGDTAMTAALEKDKEELKGEITGLEEFYVDKYADSPFACYIISSQLMYETDRAGLSFLLDKIPDSNRTNKYYLKAESFLNSLKDQTFDTLKSQYEKASALLDKDLPLNELIVKAAESFLNTPYVSGTLDNDSVEQLVINFDKFDCVTFQETCTALALDKKSVYPSYENFKSNLQKLRYRDGIIDGYLSRLHYSSDWISDNVRRGNVKDLTPELGGVKLNAEINFMSTHPSSYPKLNGETGMIKKIEGGLNAAPVYYIPKNKINTVEDKIPSGSLILITTSTAGLDFAHVGIAVREDGVLKMIHASSTAKKVVKTPSALSDYLGGKKNFTGITVLEVL